MVYNMFNHCRHIFWLVVRRDLHAFRGEAVRPGATPTMRSCSLI
ncbi:hypothetical protein COLSTE_02386 [Collinsella stercoris DSM 13279]|uniref:Uncharacterized protein n=1 Tax=Collinsella stercoris DSM 13279 TaxID=445975 RepID=B6GE49_9ACTN|nr:hypothetical protein COLSTE_02386 [Collinsella stercoris DSM 13279]